MKLLSFLIDKAFKEKIALAHCDIPCGIYDPHNAQMAAHTVLRMTSLLNDLKTEDKTKEKHDIARLTHVKEEHGHLVEDELSTLENDYFKPEHFEKYPNLKNLLEKAIQLSIMTRQNIDIKACKELLEIVLQISEIFYKTKNVEPIRVKSVYPTKEEIVTYQ
ncbi:MAG: superoxide dismutase, Ni [Candidatus Levybacteria bacterium]|nr:superoxide dismutase, Ni [Candidatus Levybacteria bacterium]